MTASSRRNRKLLYTMYKMGLLGPTRTKSANIVGQTMKLNPHGDAAIYDTMVRLSRGYEALLHPFVDSKGNLRQILFPRYGMGGLAIYGSPSGLTSVRSFFRDIDKDTVNFVDNYDNTLKEPTLSARDFSVGACQCQTPALLSGMASSICPFNLSEVCQTTIGLLRDPEFDVLSTLQAPDFPGGRFDYL